MEKKKFKVQKSDLGSKFSLRLDKFLSQKFLKLTRNYLQQVIKKGCVLVNGAKAKASKKVARGDEVKISFPLPEKIELKPEEIPLNIIYENSNIIVINKPAGLVVHPGAGNKKGTLVNALIYYLPKLKRIGSKLRPGIVHRLDKDTSGIMIVAKNDQAFQNLVKQFKEKEIKKEYLGLVYGKVKPKKGKIIAPIRRDYHDRKRMAIAGIGKGKEAETDYIVEKYYQDQFTLLKIYPRTGRTHQVRVHLNSIGYSVVGDKTYKPKQNFVNKAKELGLKRQFLHAKSLEIKLLSGLKKKFTAPLPSDLEIVLKQLENSS